MVRKRFRAIATDGDGTLLRGGHISRRTIAALKRWRDAGGKLVLVTGENARQLREFPHADLFDRIVGENGAIVLNSQKGKSKRPKERTLCPPPPRRLVRALQRACIKPLKHGDRILQSEFCQEEAIQKVLRRVATHWHIAHNRKELMVVHKGITKATGVVAALKELGLSPRETIGIGDAENDGPLLAACGLAVAVRNAVPLLRPKAEIITRGSYGKGVAELIDQVLAQNGNSAMPREKSRRHVRSRSRSRTSASG
jgi:hydroxymethylpyrimidine pyrophosphatase-like HAD family hydrolase